MLDDTGNYDYRIYVYFKLLSFNIVRWNIVFEIVMNDHLIYRLRYNVDCASKYQVFSYNLRNPNLWRTTLHLNYSTLLAGSHCRLWTPCCVCVSDNVEMRLLSYCFCGFKRMYVWDNHCICLFCFYVRLYIWLFYGR